MSLLGFSSAHLGKRGRMCGEVECGEGGATCGGGGNTCDGEHVVG